MKKLLLSGMIFAISLFNAQDKFTTFEMPYFSTGKVYNISLTNKKSAVENIYIDSETFENRTTEIKAYFSKNNLDDFIEFLNFCRNKYSEWNKTALENNVESLDKEIKGKKFTANIAFMYGDWHYAYGHYLRPRYKIFDNKHVLTISSGKVVSKTNQFITNDGLVWVFQNEEEVNNLISKLDIIKMEDFAKNKGDQKNLFE